MANVDQILYEASLGWGKGCIRFWDRLDQNSGFHGNRKHPLTYNGENDVSTFSLLFLIRLFLYLQVTRTCIRSWMSTNFGQIGPLTMELAAFERLKISRRLIMGKWSLQASSYISNRIFVRLAGNQVRHKISDEFEFWPNRISHFGVTCPCGRINFSIDIWNLQVQLTFQTLEFFVTLFLGTVRPRRLKLGTHLGSWQMYHVHRNQAAAYSSLYFFIFLSLQFSTMKFFITLFSGTVRPRRLKLGTHVDRGMCIMYTRIRLRLLIRLFISSFFFLINFEH